MKISIVKNVLFLLLLSMCFTFCGSDEEEMVVTPQPEPEVIPNATISHSIPSVISEGQQTFSIDVTLDKAKTQALTIPITIGSSTATQGEDFQITSSISIAANQTSGSTNLSILSDCLEEDDETINITVGDAGATAVNITAETISATIENEVSDVMTLSFDWSGSAEFDGTTYLFCDGEEGYVDIDIYVVDSSFSFFIDIDEGATFACPEILTLAPDSIENGVYFIVAELYFDAFDSTFNHSYPITVTADKCGGVMDSFVQSESFQFTAASEDRSTDMNETESLRPIAGLIVQDGIYGIVDLESGDPLVVGLRQDEVYENLSHRRKTELKRKR